MFTRFIKTICLILVAALLFNILPAQAFALESMESNQQAGLVQDQVALDQDVEILAEVEEKRTEYSKEFILSNGLHMAQLYASAVHYEEDGQWKEIDNTLKTSGLGINGVLTNTQGPWQVSFPQIMGSGSAVSVTKDGYTLSFSFAGKLSVSSGAQLMSSQAETYALTTGKTAMARIEQIDLTEVKESAQFAETVLDTLHSRVAYNNVYENTNIVYDLQSNKVKESIVIGKYDDALRGYRYTLNTGSLIPVLAEDGHIDFYDENRENIILVMPAPFLVDAEDIYNYDVNVTLTGDNGTYTLNYILPQSWLSASDRAWPVVLDPVIAPSMDINNIRDRSVGSISDSTQTAATLDVGNFYSVGVNRIYLKYANLPVLSSADVIVAAHMQLYKAANQSRSDPVEVHKVLEDWDSSTVTWANQPDIDETVEDFLIANSAGWYSWDVTDIARQWYATGNNYGMVFKVPNSVENDTPGSGKEFWSSDYGVASVKPYLAIFFRNTNGLEDYWDYASASAGRAGTGYVNTYTGNLVWQREHMGFGGTTMPVSISHVYNANDHIVPASVTTNYTSGNYFDMGYGWRTNIHQRVYAWGDYYVWEDADGTDHFFYWDGSAYMDEDGSGRYLQIDWNSNYARYVIVEKNSDILKIFDYYGRFVWMRNNQQTQSNIWIDYLYNPGPWPSKVTDGAGRVYRFHYNGYVLTRISYYGTGDQELAWVSFEYTDGNLTSITDWESNKSTFTYDGHILTGVTEDSEDEENSYRLEYTYHPVTNSFQPYRVASVTEYDGAEKGSSLSFSYEDNRTVLEDDLENKQILQFNYHGNVLSVQDEEGHAQYARYTRNGWNDTSWGNQLRLSSKLQNTVGNMLQDHSFEKDENLWTAGTTTADAAYLGNNSLQLTGGSQAQYGSVALEAGKTYTFSAYVKTTDATAKVGILAPGGGEYGQVLPASSDWTRLQVSYTPAADETVTLTLITEGAGSVYMDCVQLEQAVTASRYNLIENGDFRFTEDGTPAYGWTGTNLETADGLFIQAPDAPQLDTNVFRVTGNFYTEKSISQTVNISGSAGDSFVLSGWGKGKTLSARVVHGNSRDFGLRLIFNYTDGTTSEEKASFNADGDTNLHWQYIGTPAAAQKDYSSVTVKLVYDYNANESYFDGIQLYKEPFGTSYTYDDKGNVISTVDLQKQTTTYEYNTKNDLTKIIQDDKVKMTYTYDNWRNVKTATTELDQVYTFDYDTYGNNTKVSITAGELTVSSSAAYTADGQRMTSTTDALGNITRYEYDADTGLLNWVQYPENTETTRTEYTYDSMLRMTKAEMTTDTGLALNASYTYTDGKLSTIQTPSTTYSFDYGTFDLRTKVQVGSKTLAEYKYDDYNRLEKLDYGNNDNVQYTYDNLGRIIREDYLTDDGSGTPSHVAYTYDNDGNLATVFDSATGITTTYYYDLLGRAMYYTKADASGQVQSVQYTYDEKNNLSGLTESVGNSTQGYAYEYDENNRITSVTVGDTTVTYSYDAFSRLVERETKQGDTTVKTETYTFVNPTTTTTSTQVASYAVTTGGVTTTLSYTYDQNGNILSISDGTHTTSYVYDSANQLIEEYNEAEEYAHFWVYDNAGNIKSRTEYRYENETLGELIDMVEYAYKDGYTVDPETGDDIAPVAGTAWGDLLTAYDGQGITYDNIGNPVEWGNRTFTWQRGRQLASLTEGTTTWTYTYDASGMRTSRTGAGKTYTYTYNGSQLVQMTVGSDTLRFTYDAAGTPLTVTYNGTTYYYVANVQGDVVSIVDAGGNEVASYSYDAWGKLLLPEVSTEEELENAASSLEDLNPLRYRGYVYDTETGLYYVSSRYYDPEVGRFINADDIDYLGADGSPLSYNLFAYCMNNPVNRFDVNGNWSMPNWLKVAVGAVAIAGLAVATVCTGGAAAVICGAALSGAIAGGASGAVMGAIGGGISGGWQGALDGACSGFMTGTLIGGATGAASAGLNIATGATTVVGNAHGSTLHKLATNMEAGKMAASGQYSQIGINKSLGKMGLNGGLTRPDVIGIGKNGVNKLVEVVSPRQSTTYISTKMSNMLSNNSGAVGKIVNWVRSLFK